MTADCNKKESPSVRPARTETIDAEFAGQRTDNYLIRILKSMPRAHIYRLLRTGQVRVNGGRIAADRPLREGDILRIPPHFAPLAAKKKSRAIPPSLAPSVLFEDDDVLVVDKPAGLAVHGGSGLSFGLIESLRSCGALPPTAELVHRLDRETSGALIIAKKRSALRRLHSAMRAGEIEKEYRAIIVGRWRKRARKIDAPLLKFAPTVGGERRVAVRDSGAHSLTETELIEQWRGFALIAAHPQTGRTHQIRAHLAYVNLPVAGDSKYGDFGENRRIHRAGFSRMFLHSAKVAFCHPRDGRRIAVESPTPQEFADFKNFAN